jgi:hypothetical protein
MPARPWALVTGASSGIGRELSRLAAADGHDLVLLGRRSEALALLAAELRAAHGADSLILAQDLSHPDAVEAVVAALAARGIVPAFLANNAGFGAVGAHLALDPAVEEEMLAVNVVAATRLVKALLPGMCARGEGRILNVASSAGFVAGPWMAVYYASKAYLLHYSEALAVELEGSGVSVTALCPGPTPTGFQARAGLSGAQRLRRLIPPLSPTAVARAGYEGARRARRVVVPGLVPRLAVFALRFLPRRLASTLVGRATGPGRGTRGSD